MTTKTTLQRQGDADWDQYRTSSETAMLLAQALTKLRLLEMAEGIARELQRLGVIFT